MLPQEFLDRLRGQLGEAFDAFLQSYEKPRAVGLRINPLKGNAPPLPFSLEPVPWEPNGFYYQPGERPGLHPWHEAGVYYLQEPSAMAPAPLLEAQPGEFVLDLCAAPGGKSTQLAAAMDGRGLLVCNEYSPKRAKILSQNMERMGVANALVLNETPAALAASFPGCFDRILVDAPCSGEGMFRKEAAALEDWSRENIRQCAQRQLEILRCASTMLRPGGRLVYSTCTFAPEEDEGLISAFLKESPAFSLLKMDAPWFAQGSSRLVENPAPELERCLRLWPHLLRGEGHFAAVLQKNDGFAGEISAMKGEKLPTAWQDFASAFGIALPEGKAVAFGQNLFWAPKELPDLKGLRALRPGLALGELRKDRLLPSHALALWLKTGASCANFPAEGPEIAAYLQGETLPCPEKGWTLVQAGGFSLGWGKCSGGQLKNHYPKGLRRNAASF